MAADLPPFVHLHVHSEYSFLDGACRVERLPEAAAEMGMPAIALTDHGGMYGAIAFAKACDHSGVRPLIGCELYLAPRSRRQREGKADAELRHLPILAETEEGYRNLIRLVSLSHLEGFYYKPRADRELVSQYAKGLIGLSGCLGGEIPALLLAGREEEARRLAGEYGEIFGGENFFLEVMDTGLRGQREVNPKLLELGRELGLGLVATNDVHYLQREDAAAHDLLLCLQTGATVDEPDRLRFEGREYYLKSGAEMAELFGECPEALCNTVRLAERCRARPIPGDRVFPAFAVPEGDSADSYLRRLCEEELPRRCPGGGEEARERVEYELGIIAEKQLSTYILIIWDLMRFAREKGILTGPGRGSAPGSLALYVLGVTQVDPLRYKIPFERWLHAQRQSLPDIDCDFEDTRRDEVISYLIEKYGSDRVAQIITFGTLGARLAVRDVGRALKVPIAEVDRIAKLIDPTQKLGAAIETVPEIQGEYENNPAIRELLEGALALEGLVRHASTHAAGVVIGREPLINLVPLQRATEGEGSPTRHGRYGDGATMTQFEGKAVEECGLLKMDILGLRTLSVLREALRLIEESRGLHLRLDEIPLDDAATYELIARGETTGVFQLESAGMRRVAMELKPTGLEDIMALVALYRPGPMAQIPNFVTGKNGQRPVTFAHPKLEPVLKETYGIIVYQEQVMEIARALAGFSPEHAEELLTAMRRKKHEKMAALREEFLRGAKANHVGQKVASSIFDQMSEFAGYGFNKAHSVSYALNAYQTAYLKTHFPAEFMAAQLTSVMGDKDKMGAYLQDCRKLGLSVLPPDVNRSGEKFRIESGGIRLGLAAVKHAARNTVEAILAAREEGGPFRDLFDLAGRVDPSQTNRLALESLIKAGALASLGGNRAQLLAALEQSLDSGQRSFEQHATGQASLFSEADRAGASARFSPRLPRLPELPRNQLLALERELLGVFLSDHPLSEVAGELELHTTASCEDLKASQTREGNGESPPPEEVIVGGLVTSSRRRTTRTGKPMLFLTLEDLTGSVEVTVFPATFERDGEGAEPQAVLLVKGRVEASYRSARGREGGGRPSLIASALALLSDAQAVARLKNAGASKTRNGPRPRYPGRARRGARATGSPGGALPPPEARPAKTRRVHIRLPGEAAPEKLGQLRELLSAYQGETEVLLHLELETGETKLKLGEEFVVSPTAEFTRAAASLLGEGAVWVE